VITPPVVPGTTSMMPPLIHADMRIASISCCWPVSLSQSGHGNSSQLRCTVNTPAPYTQVAPAHFKRHVAPAEAAQLVGSGHVPSLHHAKAYTPSGSFSGFANFHTD